MPLQMSILPRPPFYSFQCHSSLAAIFPLHLITLAHALSSLCISFAYSARPHRYNAYASMTHHSTTCTQHFQSPLPHTAFHCKFSFSRARHFILSNALLSQLSVLLHTLCLPMHIMPTSCSVLAMHNIHIPRAQPPPASLFLFLYDSPHNTCHCKFSFSRAHHFILSNAFLTQLSVLLHTLCLPNAYYLHILLALTVIPPVIP